jgi:hypothetical protein
MGRGSVAARPLSPGNPQLSRPDPDYQEQASYSMLGTIFGIAIGEGLPLVHSGLI